ncbi:hypothetical protein P1P75_27325 [Streptomyces sp. ID05-39B]|uniref:hypothetical protein n=1 Tax=Streptomyces sp. ID05-39B TaxID=3028664 RepID=UPI0029A4346E|nr:hypothetical protein [Streptomyces sp. ID05-39B]MDX3530026.1 hypothetical protein [Streptomyces sp. ID05-39B]
MAAGTLLATAACSSGDDGAAADTETAAAVAERPLAAQTTPLSPTATATGSVSATPSASATSPTATTSPAAPLSEAGARNALITAADIEDNWVQVKDPETWRDKLLIGEVDTAQFVTGKADAADCQRLVDSLYDETLLGRPSGASALNGFQQGQSRLLYQVAAYDKAALDKSMDWLAKLPQTCDQFTLTGGDSGDRTVQVVETSLPKEGDARQGLTVTMKGTTNGDPVTLTLDVAVVRVGNDAITITNGGLDGADENTTKTAAEQGTERLKEVQAGRTPTPTPSNLD